MLSKNINFKNFLLKKNTKKIRNNLTLLLREKNEILRSLTPGYDNSYKKIIVKKLKKYPKVKIIGMGGSTLGAKSIFNFLEHKIKKKFYFIDNLHGKTKYIDKKNA